MNRIYRTVWNAARGCWQVAGELGPSRGKQHARGRRLARSVFAGVLVGWALPLSAAELPTGADVQAGEGHVERTGDTLTVHQASDRLAIDWKGFSFFGVLGRGRRP